jgi:type IV pilus assembly protein PilC
MFGSPRISMSRLADLCRRVGTSLSAGVSARDIWTREAERGSARERRMLVRVRDAVNEGESVAAAMQATDGFFPPLVSDMVDVGERTGKIDEVLLRLADHYEHLVGLRRTFLLGIIWPALQLLAAVAIVGLLIWLMGYLGDLAGEPVDMLGLGLAGTRGLVIYLLFVLAIAGLVAFAVVGAGRGWAGSGPIMRVAIRVPFLGDCLRTMALTRLAWALAMTNESGMDARRSVAIALASTNIEFYQRHARKIDRMLAEGGPVHEAFRTTRAFPDDFVDSLEAAEQAGRLAEAMTELSNQYRQRAQAASTGLTFLAAFAAWGMVALVISVLIIRLGMYYVDLLNRVMEGRF